MWESLYFSGSLFHLFFDHFTTMCQALLNTLPWAKVFTSVHYTLLPHFGFTLMAMSYTYLFDGNYTKMDILAPGSPQPPSKRPRTMCEQQPRQGTKQRAFLSSQRVYCTTTFWARLVPVPDFPLGVCLPACLPSCLSVRLPLCFGLLPPGLPAPRSWTPLLPLLYPPGRELSKVTSSCCIIRILSVFVFHPTHWMTHPNRLRTLGQKNKKQTNKNSRE